MNTIYSKFVETVQANRKRPVVRWKENSKWQDCSYEKFLQLVDNLAGNFIGLGVEKKNRVPILSENRWEWLASDLALNKIGAISVPIHAVSNIDTIEYILKDSESEYLLISENIFKKRYDFFQSYEDLEETIVFSDSKEGLADNVLLFKDLLGEENKKEVEPSEGDIVSIIYTSGTTGEPKGVMLTNENFLSNISAVKDRIDVNSRDVFLSFMPVSHILERTAGSYIPILSGACIAYAENINKLSDNFFEIKPTLFISVPKIFERSYEKIFASFKEKSKILKNIFFWSLKQKPESFGKKIAEILILKKLRSKVYGGKLRFAVSGGASINEKILKFFQNVGIRIVEGYGLTETSPIIAVNSLEKSKVGAVGYALDNVQIKINSDKEVLAKGPNIMKGYWKKDQETAMAIDEDGWFCTGDLGFLDQDDFLTIIGRKKEIIVTTNGKNIAPEKLEGIINLNQFIEQALVVGHRRSFLSALIIPDKNAIESKFGPSDKNLIKEIIEEEIKKINCKLEAHEQIKKIEVLDKSFSIEAGELTPTLKVRRKIIEREYEKIIGNLYN